MASVSSTSLPQIVQKMEYYCSYQERCHLEVMQKLYGFSVSANERDEIMVHLIQHNFLNEERFAKTFAISKFHQKSWGKNRIVNELKARHILLGYVGALKQPDAFCCRIIRQADIGIVIVIIWLAGIKHIINALAFLENN